jgi:glycine cleavage system H protein
MARDPEGLRFARTHEWIALEGNQAIIGISNHAQDQLGDVVYVEVPSVGQNVSAGAAFGVIESVKAASDLYSPLAGRVVEVNTKLADHPELVNQDPYGDGWMIKLEASGDAAAALSSLMSHQEYQGMLKTDAG